jgi:hypothetical protein
MIPQETSYLERLKVSWLLFWRGTLMGLAVAFMWGHLVGLVWGPLGMSVELAQGINVFGGYAFSVIVIGPLLVQMLLRKQFKGFRLEFVRVQK